MTLVNNFEVAQVPQTLDKIRSFFKSGKTKDINWRIKQLKKLKNAIEKYEVEICDALKKDLNKHPYEVYATEIGMVAKEINTAIKKVKKWAKPKKVKTPLFLDYARSYIYQDPYGIVLVIAPWNFPFQLQILPVIGAIAAGNVVVMKPSEFSNHTTEIIKKIIAACFEDDFVKVFEGGPEVSKALLKEKFDYIFFTGSSRVGQIVYEAAAKNLTPVTLELGGKCPCIVDENTHLKYTAERLVWGKFVNCGQVCLAPNYLFVHKNIKEKALEIIIKTIKKNYGEDAKQSEDYGRIITDHHHQRISDLIKNKPLLCGGDTDASQKYIAPTLVEVSDLNDPIMHREIFGPVLPVYTYSDIQEVIDYINSQPKPLATYIFTKNNALADRVFTETSSGGACQNDTVMHMVNDNMAFGGVGESGLGGYHGKFSFDAFSHQKSVYRNSFLVDFPFRYPPYKYSKNLIKKLIKYLG